MPAISDYKCRKCGFELPSGWGHYFYVEDDEGERIICPHPEEDRYVRQVLGVRELSPEIVRSRTGFNSHCVCLDCLHQFDADLGETGYSPYESFVGIACSYEPRRRPQKDKRECAKCRSENVKTALELVLLVSGCIITYCCLIIHSGIRYE
jgi:hypothetical protein